MNEEIQVIKKKPKNVFKNKNYVLVFLGALVSNIASLFYSFAVSFYILKITDNNALIQGLYLAAGAITFCIVSLFGGVISDRFDKAKIMYICDFLKGIVILGFTMLLILALKQNTGQIVGLFVVNILSNILAGIFSPASQALIPQIVDEASYQQAQSYFSILNSFQSIVGVILAGILYSLIPINVLFLIVGTCYIISAISEMFIKYEHKFEKENEKLSMKLILSDIKDGFKYVVSIKAIFAMIICILFINFFFTPIFNNLSPYFVATDIANSNYMFNEYIKAEMWESFFSVAVGLGSLIMGIIVSFIPQQEKCNYTVRYSMMGISALMIVLTIGFYLFKYNVIGINFLLIVLLVALFLIGALIILINVPSAATMMKIVDKDKMGKISSVSNIGSQGLIPLSMVLGGIALNYFGAPGMLLCSTLGVLITSLILFFNPHVRKI